MQVLTLDHLFHLAELLPIGFACWKLMRAANRLLDVLENYPPHLHVNGKIVYPKSYSPGKITQLNIQP